MLQNPRAEGWAGASGDAPIRLDLAGSCLGDRLGLGPAIVLSGTGLANVSVRGQLRNLQVSWAACSPQPEQGRRRPHVRHRKRLGLLWPHTTLCHP